MQRRVVPELVGEEHADVAHAAAFFQAANRLTIFLGPRSPGADRADRTAQILYIDAATYVVSFASSHVRAIGAEVPAPRTAASRGRRFMLRDKLLRIWTPAFTLLDICWQLIFASLPVLVVTQYHANPRVLGWLFGALGGGALVGAFASMRSSARSSRLALGAVAFIFQMGSLWTLAIPAPWYVALAGMALAGFFMSLVNTPMQALVSSASHAISDAGDRGVRRLQLHRRADRTAPRGRPRLARYDTTAVLTVVLACGAAAIVIVRPRARSHERRRCVPRP